MSMAWISTESGKKRRLRPSGSTRLGTVASVLSMELFDALVAREILVIISQNSENAGYEKAAALPDYTLQKETRRA